MRFREFILRYMNNVKSVDLATYRHKDVVRIRFEQWMKVRGENVAPPEWLMLVEASLGHFYIQELRKGKTKYFSMRVHQSRARLYEFKGLEHQVYSYVVLCSRYGS